MPETLPPSRLIDPVRLQPLLGEARGRFDVDAIAECGSTNTLLLDRAAQGAPSGSVIVVDRQTAGRGSRGRSWLASPEASLTFSVLWRFSGGLESLAGLSLAAGVAVVHGLESCGAQGVGLKWPNDILHAEGKLGGILVELHSDDASALAVVGIGLNLRLPELRGSGEGFALRPVALDQAMSSLPERHALFAALLVEMARVFDRFEASGFAALREQWQARNAWQDKPVRLLRGNQIETEGICRGADADGALLVQTPNGIERCISGDLSLRSKS
jgi:BirA family biotin operon repressor/biotin-[acetyl-CoA-carboxylase] ligase